MYLMLLMHFLENKVAVELTRAEFVEAQEVCSQPLVFHILSSLRMRGQDSLLFIPQKIKNQLII